MLRAAVIECFESREPECAIAEGGRQGVGETGLAGTVGTYYHEAVAGVEHSAAFSVALWW